jgi:Ca-activated chloride channel family protein
MNPVFAVFFLCLFLGLSTQPASAGSREGNNLYDPGDSAGSVREYMDARSTPSDSDLVRFNMGAAFYKNGQYKEALQELLPLLDSSRADLDTALRKRAFYNAANAYFREKQYQQALDAVNGALAIDSAYANARQNKSIIEKYLEQQQQQQQNQDKNSSSSAQSSSSGESQSSGSQSSASQSSGSQSSNSQSSGSQSSGSQSADSQSSDSQSSASQSADSRSASSGEQPSSDSRDSLQMSREQAEQLLKDFQEHAGERRPWRGKRPEKDW